MKSQFIVLIGGLLLLVACGGPPRDVPAPTAAMSAPPETLSSPESTVISTLQSTPTDTPTSPPSTSVATDTLPATTMPLQLALTEAEIAYLDDARCLWLMDADGTARRRITTCGNVRAFAWSPDGQTLAYLVNGAAWLYDMQNGKCKCLLSALPDHDLGLRLSWSPHKQYLVLNEGTSLSQRLSIIEVATGSVVRKIDVIGYAWSPDEENLLIGKRHHLEKPITVQPGDAVDLAVISPGDPKTPPDVLLEGSAQVLYFPFDWLSDGQIQYSRLDWDEAAQTGEQSYWAAPWKNGELGEPEPISYPYQHNGDAQMRQRIVERLQLGDDYDPGTLYWTWSPDHTHLVVEVEQRGRELYLLEWESSAPPRFLGSGKEPRWRPRRSKPTTLPTASSTAQGP